MVFSSCFSRFHRILMLVYILTAVSILYIYFSTVPIASRLQYVSTLSYNRSITKVSIVPLSSSLRRFARHNREDENMKPNRTEMLLQAVKNMRNLPRVPFVAENPSPSLAYNHSCAVYPSILDIQFTNSYWQRANTSWGTFFIYGAYYDNRSHFKVLNGPSVRILGVIEQYFEAERPKDYCHLWFGGETSPIAEKEYIFYTKKSRSKYASYLFKCPIPRTYHNKVPHSVSIVHRPCDNALNLLGVQYQPSELRKGFAICTKGFDFPKQDLSVRLIEWIEMNRVLGAEKIFFYKYNPVHPNVTKVFDYYRHIGFADVTPYTMPGYLPNEANLRHLYLQSPHRMQELIKTEIIPYNDCLYRNLYKYEYLVVVDTDEIIMPLSNISTWDQIVGVVKKEHSEGFYNIGAICFQNVYFFDYWLKGKPLFPSIPSYMYHLQHVYRANNLYRRGLQSKCFHIVQMVLTLYNHAPIKCLNSCKKIHVEPTKAQLQHYKPNCPSYITNCSQAIGENPSIDTTIWKYKNSVIRRTVHTMKTIGFIAK